MVFFSDEGALVKGAKGLGFVFTGRTPHSVIMEAVSVCIMRLFSVYVYWFHKNREGIFKSFSFKWVNLCVCLCASEGEGEEF